MNDQQIGVGPTQELSLRVSVATLARIVFPHPKNGIPMLALEHKATWFPGDNQDQVSVKVQPFGGAVRILNLNNFLSQVRRFNFDSQRSRSEQDFRVFIRPDYWGKVQEYCLHNLSREEDTDLESDPSRELEEEFEDALGIHLQSEQYYIEPLKIIVEGQPAQTANIYAVDTPTVRIYRVFNIQISDLSLHRMMIANSEQHPHQILQRMAFKDGQKTGRGRANAILAAPEAQIRAVYQSVPPEQRGKPLPFADTVLEGNVAAVVEDIFVPKYSS